VFVPGKPFQLGPMFVGKARSLSSRAEQTKDTGLAHKHQTKLERQASEKHSSLLRKLVNYGRSNEPAGVDFIKYTHFFWKPDRNIKRGHSLQFTKTVKLAQRVIKFITSFCEID
jgi:hypothetical protein